MEVLAGTVNPSVPKVPSGLETELGVSTCSDVRWERSGIPAENNASPSSIMEYIIISSRLALALLLVRVDVFDTNIL